MIKTVLTRLRQPSTWAGLAAMCTGVAQAGGLTIAALPVLFAGLAAVLVDG